MIPTNLRLVRRKEDRGTQFTSSAFRQYCRATAIKLEYASLNTLHQMGANERAGKTIAGIARCLLTHSSVSKFVWGELILTTVYLSIQAPPAALANAAPYKTLYSKDSYLRYPREIGPRAFVHVERHTKNLNHRSWEGHLAGYSVDSKSFRVEKNKTRSIYESRNVIFTETPFVLPESDLMSSVDEGDFFIR